MPRYEFCWYDMEKRVIGGSLPTPGSEREKKFEETKAYLHATVRRIADENRKRREHEVRLLCLLSNIDTVSSYLQAPSQPCGVSSTPCWTPTSQTLS